MPRCARWIPAIVWRGLVVSVLMSGATLMELNAQVDEVNVQLAEAQSEYDYLNTKMNDITSRASLQEVAEGQLGLVKLDPEPNHLCPVGRSEHNRKKQQFRRPPAGQGPHGRPEPAGQPEPVKQ